MTQDCKDFLETLLFVADDTESEEREFANATIYDFAPAFVAAAESFLSGFRDYLSKQDNDLADNVDGCERSFSGNVFFTLSGHGCGFWDDRDGELGDYLADQLHAYSGSRYRFEELQHSIAFNEDGKIDMAFIPSAIEEYRTKIFTV